MLMQVQSDMQVTHGSAPASAHGNAHSKDHCTHIHVLMTHTSPGRAQKHTHGMTRGRLGQAGMLNASAMSLSPHALAALPSTASVAQDTSDKHSSRSMMLCRFYCSAI